MHIQAWIVEHHPRAFLDELWEHDKVSDVPASVKKFLTHGNADQIVGTLEIEFSEDFGRAEPFQRFRNQR
jgi:hypothetical protein